jgi:hypothetical protein
VKQILTAVISIGKENLPAVVQNFQCQLQMVMDANGANTENVFT